MRGPEVIVAQRVGAHTGVDARLVQSLAEGLNVHPVLVGDHHLGVSVRVIHDERQERLRPIGREKLLLRQRSLGASALHVRASSKAFRCRCIERACPFIRSMSSVCSGESSWKAWSKSRRSL